MLEKLIAFLKWIQSNEKIKNRIDLILSMFFVFVTGLGAYSIIKELPYDGYTLATMTGGIITSGLIIFLLFSLISVYIYTLYKRLRDREFSVINIIINSALPLLVGVIVATIYSTGSDMDLWYVFIFGGLYALSPYLLFISGLRRFNNKPWKRLSDFYKKYIISFLIGFAIFFLFFIIGDSLGFEYMSIPGIIIMTTMILIPYLITTWLVLTYAWTTLDTVDESSWKNILRGGVGLAFVFLAIWITPDIKDSFIDNRIKKAQIAIQKLGETREGYEEASSIWGLQWSMEERFLDGRLYQQTELYSKVFDESIENVIDTELDTNKYSRLGSNGTTLLARGKNAKVELNFAKHESVVISDIGAVETTVTYEFQNTDTQNQEVIYTIELPNVDSVVTELKLGPNLELLGVLAPRGAAEKVYQDSLRRSIDPALLEQTGPKTYRLRVFPVLSRNDNNTHGRQRVQFKYITPIQSDKRVTLIPKTDILNLRLTEKSNIMTRLTEGTRVILQDSETTDNISTLNTGKTTIIDTNIDTDYSELCSATGYIYQDVVQDGETQRNLTKNIVFIDASKSVGEDPSIRNRYQELINTWKDNGFALDIYTFNTSIASAGYNILDIDFWGNTEMAGVIGYIEKNNIQNANIVILTDDSSYESVLKKKIDINYGNLKSNRISVIQIGEKIRTLKSEVSKSVLATEGGVLSVGKEGDITTIVSNIFTLDKPKKICKDYTGVSTGALLALQGNLEAKKIFGNTIYKTGKESKLIYPTFFNQGTYSLEEKTSTGGKVGSGVIYDMNGDMATLYLSAGGNKTDIVIDNSGYYLKSGSVLILKEFPNPVNILVETTKQLSDSEALQYIGSTAHIVNQSMSLIALETDSQRADLERYSSQYDAYDTTYNNLDNARSGIRFGFENASSDSAGFTLSSDSVTLRGGTSTWGGGDTKKIVQYLIVLMLFPIITWFVLRRKQKSKIVSKDGE